MSQVKILIVEDEKDVLELIRYNLNNNGYGTETALTGWKALEKAIDYKPDLILLDLMLPEIDGLEVCDNLKNNTITAAIPVVMLTAKGTEADIVKGLQMGASDYITKPFSPRDLLARIKHVLNRQATAAK
jgi:two-component system phosphate regulon response regulator PhoB